MENLLSNLCKDVFPLRDTNRITNTFISQPNFNYRYLQHILRQMDNKKKKTTTYWYQGSY